MATLTDHRAAELEQLAILAADFLNELRAAALDWDIAEDEIVPDVLSERVFDDIRDQIESACNMSQHVQRGLALALSQYRKEMGA